MYNAKHEVDYRMTLLIPFSEDSQTQYLTSSINPNCKWIEKESFLGTFLIVKTQSNPVFHIKGIMFENESYSCQIVDSDIEKALVNITKGTIGGIWNFKNVDRYFSLTLVESRPPMELHYKHYVSLYRLLYQQELINYLTHMKHHPNDTVIKEKYQQLQKTITSDLKSKSLPIEIKGILMKEILKAV